MNKLGIEVKTPEVTKNIKKITVDTDSKCCICFDELDKIFMHCRNNEENDHHVCIKCYEQLELSSKWSCPQCKQGYPMEIRKLT